MKDFYGNETQQETPTLILLNKRRKAKQQTDSHFKIGTKVHPYLHRQAMADYLRKIADAVETSKSELFKFELIVEEVKEAYNNERITVQKRSR